MVVIRAEEVGKKYLIHHESTEPRYLALRDVVNDKLRNLWSGNTSDTTREEFWALRNVSFEVEEGDRLGVIGRNGAGKSTLLKLISRITELSSGRLSIKGRIASLLEVGTGFHPELTGRENILLNGTILGMKRWEIKKKFDEIVSFAEVEKFLDTPVKRYSSGMHVRLAFSVAAHLEQEILAVDEVLAVGDADFQKKCLGKMEDVSKGEGRTILFVSHNMNIIRRLCNKCLILDRGLIKYNGQTDEAIEKYLSSDSNSLPTFRSFDRDEEKRINITRLEIVNEDDKPINPLIGHFEKLSLNLAISISKDSHNIVAVYQIINSQGEIVLHNDRTDFHGELLSLDKGKYLISMDLPNPLLVEGKYYLTVAMREQNDPDSLVILDKEVSFEISNTELRRSKPRKGYCFVPSEWEITSVVS